MGSLSMTCYSVGLEPGCTEAIGAAELPQDVPPDQTNV
jgi:hypothetical protein